MLEKILPLYKLSSGCDYHRLLLPLGFAGYDFTSIGTLTTEKLKEFKILTFNRIPLTVSTTALLKLREKYDTKIVMDIDDYWELYKDHYLYDSWMKTKTPERIVSFLQIADSVTCTTERLASKIRPINPNVAVIPNAMPFGFDDQFGFRRAEVTKTRFGFVGGTSHVSDMKSIQPVFQHYKHLDFTFCGYTERSKEAIKIRNICSNNGTNPNFKAVNQAPLDKYMYGYDNLDCCIAPLVEEEFNKYKSNLKVLEAGLKKCAIICSPNPCYTDTVPDTVVTYCKSIKDWKEAVRKYQDLAYTREKGEALYDWVNQNYNLAEINKLRTQLYETLLTRSQNG